MGEKIIINLEQAKSCIADNLMDGYDYDECLQFGRIAGDNECDLEPEALLKAQDFFNRCEGGMNPFEAYVRAFC